jgi:hypothetical protein
VSDFDDVRVVKVLSDFEVVIDAGSAQGVRLRQKLLVYTLADMIKDSQGEDLERLEVVRGLGSVTHVQAKISTVRSSETAPPKVVRRSSDSPLFSSSFRKSIIEETAAPEEQPFRSPQVGDRVKGV